MLFQAVGICAFDVDGNGLISLAEFLSVASGATESESNAEFRFIDSNGTEMIDPGEIKEYLRLVGEFQGADNANQPPPNEGYQGNEPYYPPAPEALLLNRYQDAYTGYNTPLGPLPDDTGYYDYDYQPEPGETGFQDYNSPEDDYAGYGNPGPVQNTFSQYHENEPYYPQPTPEAPPLNGSGR